MTWLAGLVASITMLVGSLFGGTTIAPAPVSTSTPSVSVKSSANSQPRSTQTESAPSTVSVSQPTSAYQAPNISSSATALKSGPGFTISIPSGFSEVAAMEIGGPGYFTKVWSTPDDSEQISVLWSESSGKNPYAVNELEWPADVQSNPTEYVLTKHQISGASAEASMLVITSPTIPLANLQATSIELFVPGSGSNTYEVTALLENATPSQVQTVTQAILSFAITGQPAAIYQDAPVTPNPNIENNAEIQGVVLSLQPPLTSYYLENSGYPASLSVLVSEEGINSANIINPITSQPLDYTVSSTLKSYRLCASLSTGSYCVTGSNGS